MVLMGPKAVDSGNTGNMGENVAEFSGCEVSL